MEITKSRTALEGGYMSDTDSDLELGIDQQAEDGASSDSRASSAEDGQATSKTRLRKESRGGRSAHSVSFSSKSTAHREMEKRIGFDGREVTLVTLDTQTDWDWLEGAQKAGKVKVITPSEEKIDRPQRLSTGTSPGSLKSILVKPDSRETASRPRTGGTTISSMAESRPETNITPFSLLPNDEYGIPLLDMSSTSDDSSDEEMRKRPQKATLPSVGPPQILKYVRESEMKEMVIPESTATTHAEEVFFEAGEMDFPVDEDGNPAGMFRGPCEFCGKMILPLPSMEMQQSQDPESLYCCEEYCEFIQFATSTVLQMEEEAQKANKIINVKVHPHHGSKKARTAAKERAVERMRQRELQRRQQEAAGSQANFYSAGVNNGALPSSLPGRPTQTTLKPNNTGVGGGARVGLFKDMATPASFRGQASTSAAGNASHGHFTYGVSHEGRQMKTINYQLSSQRCLEEGWTLRPPTPPDFDESDIEVFIPEPLHPAVIASGNIRERQIIEKFYPSGNKFLTIFPDGTGNVFYPSGHLAIMITSVSLGRYFFIVHDDGPGGLILAVFDPQGIASVNFANGKIRMFYDQINGLELDVLGAKKKRWFWKDPDVHVHAPPLQPLCMRLNQSNSIRVMTQESVALTFMANKRSCRFQLGNKAKACCA
ncbi:uncharacterized protein LOC112555421 isoform X2 [Pomacea canaliculata]|uniref:uncharacterized protein LOC112555421 isoform X2 n=1 Tax=Pomacea canaliculata TaxID=400727 RepID=UPI000D73833D|nr:uncharacterized protein LOC112555421 isoform X2 [Pomacea canaliculata]